MINKQTHNKMSIKRNGRVRAAAAALTVVGVLLIVAYGAPTAAAAALAAPPSSTSGTRAASAGAAAAAAADYHLRRRQLTQEAKGGSAAAAGAAAVPSRATSAPAPAAAASGPANATNNNGTAAAAPSTAQSTAKLEAAPSGPAPPHSRCAPGAPVAENGTCACAAGWLGRDCMTCAAGGSVCPAFTGQAASVCDARMAYNNATRYKAYSCDLVGGLSKWVTGVSAVCNVWGERLPYKDGPMGLLPGGLLDASAPQGAEANRFCKLEVGLVSQPANPLVCLVSKCKFEAGSPSFLCSAVSCSCGAGARCPKLIESVVANLANSTLGLTCNPSGDGRCVLDGVQPRFSLMCRSGECTQPEPRIGAPAHALAAGGPVQAPPRAFPRIALISALPIVLLLGFGGVFLSWVLAGRRMFKAGAAPAAPPPPPADPKAVQLLAPQPSIVMRAGDPDPTTAFVFDGVVCCVPDAKAAPTARARVAAIVNSLRGGNAGAAATAHANDGSSTGAAIGARAGGGLFAALGPLQQQPSLLSAAAAAAAARAAPPGAPPPPEAAPGRKVLLHGVSGVVDQGEVLGVMGPSGSGKSTLLSILSGSAESVGAGARVEGTVSLGGERRRSALRKVTAFVPQKDVLLPALTVEECVRYSALLRLPRRLGAQEIQDRIDGVLSELGLSHVASSLVGGSASIRGVSGGERRRVTIAMALVTRPRLVIMDEPTSGLDSYTAYNLMRTAQDIAAAGRVIIMSLHQPSPDMFESLSQVLLLVKGRLAYLGPPAGVAPHFAAAGLPVPRKRQPAEHMLHVASQPAGLAALLEYAGRCADARRRIAAASALIAQQQQQQQQSQQQQQHNAVAAPAVLVNVVGGELAEPVPECTLRFKASPFAASMTAAAAAAVGSAGSDADSSASSLESTSAPPAGAAGTKGDGLSRWKSFGSRANLLGADGAVSSGGPRAARARGAASALGRWAARSRRECAVLYWRAFTNMRREPRLLLLHALVALVLGLVVGAVFFQLENTQVGVQNRLGSMFFALALFGWTSVSVVDGLVLERELVEREVGGHYYRGGTYLLASLVLDGLLLRTAPALLFCGLMYPMVGLLPEATRVATFMFVLATYTCTVGALTTALAALCRSASATTLAMNIILLMWVLVGGYLVNPMSIPTWLRWVRCLSPMSFAFEVLAANEMADQVYALRVAGFAQLDGIKGDVFLRTLGLVPSRALESAVALSAFYIGSVLLAFAATTYTLWKAGGGSLRRLATRPLRRWRQRQTRGGAAGADE